jgi:hypothetical protein
MTILSTIEQYAEAALSALSPKANGTTTSTPTASMPIPEFTTGLAFVQTLITAIETKSFTAKTGQVAVEDVVEILADIAIPGPGAQLVAKVLPLLFAGVTLAASRGVGAFAPDPVHPDDPTQFSRGR